MQTHPTCCVCILIQRQNVRGGWKGSLLLGWINCPVKAKLVVVSDGVSDIKGGSSELLALWEPNTPHLHTPPHASTSPPPHPPTISRHWSGISSALQHHAEDFCWLHHTFVPFWYPVGRPSSSPSGSREGADGASSNTRLWAEACYST